MGNIAHGNAAKADGHKPDSRKFKPKEGAANEGRKMGSRPYKEIRLNNR